MNEEVQIKKPRGRPPKAKVNQKKVGHRKALGRPKGDAAIINEYKARMLASPKSKKVIEAIFDAALDDEHKNQSAAWKLIMDRMLPVSYFEKEATGGRSAVSITISSLGGAETTITQEKDVIEGEVISDDV
tara:strand:+ start:294 stop:686 length:393 start_codon:yes stop_codon:yes gene_type:complete